ncbi:muscle M-line assembly protein unc-89-like [Uloborus diversus]|uniref:muscle M-line assembly protein unc-89-like n=1 Tax=Uloborus diversus TaxID=327109 RepID=UPI00240A2C3B|nr:muscle M-line assembly protein unc-89-like [Uloborus diversus]
MLAEVQGSQIGKREKRRLGLAENKMQEVDAKLFNSKESAASGRRANEIRRLDAYLQAWLDANDIEDTEELRHESDNVISEIDCLENLQENSAPSHKERKSRLVEDFLIPALNYKTYGDLLMWDPLNPSCFLLSWTHKAASAWNLEQAAVFAAWDEIKGRPVPKNRLDFVYSKQRMRAALKAAKNIEGVKGFGGYRRYKILNLDNYEVQQDFKFKCPSNGDENVPNNTQLVLKEDLIFEDYHDTAGSPEPPETEKRKQNSSEKRDLSPEKQNSREMTPYHRHTRSLTQKIVEICPDSKATLFEEIDDMPRIRKKYPPKRSVQQAFNEEMNGGEAATEPKEDCTLPKKKKPPSPKKRKRRIRRFTPKKKPPSKHLRKWKRPKKTVKINIKEYSVKNRKIIKKASAPLQYSVLENESLYWKTLDQMATEDVKQEPIENFVVGVSEKSNHESPVENEQIVPESTTIKISSESVLNSNVKDEPMEFVSEENFFSQEPDEESEYESEPPSPASDPDTSVNASLHQDLKGSGHSLIRDFVIPALDNETYGDLLKWDSDDPSVFWIKWTHKAKSSWSKSDAAVFIGWDIFKGRRTPKTPLDFVDAKQRLRAAFRNLKTVEHVQMKKGYRGYRIFALAGVESIRERKITVQKYLKAAQEMEEAYCKSQAAAKLKSKEYLLRPKLKTKPKLRDHLEKKGNSPSASPKNSSELLDSYHHHTRSLTRKMVEICPNPKPKRRDQFNGVFKISTSEEKENIAQSSKIPRTPTNEHKKPVHEINLFDIYHDIHLIRQTKPTVRYEETHDTIKEARPPWTVPKDAKCTVCLRPANSACFYCCVVYYCSTECSESLINKSHYEFCKDKYLSKLNVIKLHRPIAEKQPCL